MLKFTLTLIMRVISRFIWMGIGFAVITIFGRGTAGRSVKMSLKMLKRMTRI